MQRTVLVLCAAATLSVSAKAAWAQEEGYSEAAGCGYNAYCSGGHTVPPIGAGYKYAHMGCMYCTTGDWRDCHPDCTVSFADPLVRKLYATMVAQAQQGRADAVIRLASAVPDRVYFNQARGAVQVLSCNGESVVASLNVTPNTPLYVSALALPRVGRHLAEAVAGPQ